MPRSASAIQTSLDTWYAARDAIATGQGYSINGRTLTRANLDQVNKTIQMLERDLAYANSASTGRNRLFVQGKLGGMGY